MTSLFLAGGGGGGGGGGLADCLERVACWSVYGMSSFVYTEQCLESKSHFYEFFNL